MPDERLQREILKRCRRTPGGCWPWALSTNHQGYGVMSWPGTPRRRSAASRVSFVAFVRDLREGEIVCHTCDNPACVNPAHLYAGTHADNQQDCVRRGRKPWGESCGRSKLAADEVLEIARELAAHASVQDVASRHGVSETAVRKIRSGITWRRLTRPAEGVAALVAWSI